MLTLRMAAPRDSAALAEIYRPYVEETSISFETAAPGPAEFRNRVETISARYPYLVAEAEGEILGYAYAHAFHERAAYDWTAETSIYIRRDVRGQRLGRRLYTALLTLLEAQGVRNVCAVITIPNDPSIGFHHAMGFSDCGLLPDFGYKLGRWRSVAYLSLALGEREAVPGPILSVRALDPGFTAKVLKDSAVS